MLHDALAHCESEIEPAKRRIALLEPGDDAQGMEVVIEAEPVTAQSFVECLFAGVAKGRMAYVVSERQGLGEFVVEAECGGDGTGDLRDFECVRQAAAEVIARVVAGKSREDLGLSGKTAEGARMQDAGTVASEGGPVGMFRVGVLPRRELSLALHSDIRGQGKARVNWLAHPWSMKSLRCGYNPAERLNAREWLCGICPLMFRERVANHQSAQCGVL